ncbi:hypothetical protein HYS82_02265 [Candidatus Amesbacteria bacterium]|nr:hypothetical protein [Candidatus Amesbacteria bacterium]
MEVLVSATVTEPVFWDPAPLSTLATWIPGPESATAALGPESARLELAWEITTPELTASPEVILVSPVFPSWVWPPDPSDWFGVDSLGGREEGSGDGDGSDSGVGEAVGAEVGSGSSGGGGGGGGGAAERWVLAELWEQKEVGAGLPGPRRARSEL